MKTSTICILLLKQAGHYNQAVCNILTMEIPMILPNLNKHKRIERGIVTALVTSFIWLAYERISSYLHVKRQKAIQKASRAIGRNVECRYG